MSVIKKNFLYNLVLTISTILFPIITFPYASRILGPEGIGKVQFVTNFAQYFVIVAALGIPVYGIREVAKLKDRPLKLKQFFTEMILLNLTTSILLAVIYLSLVYLIPSLYLDIKYYNACILIIVFGFCNIDWFFSGLERFKFIAGRSLLIKGLSLIFLFFFVKEKNDDLIYLWISIGIISLNNFWNIWSARSYLDKKYIGIGSFRKHLIPLFFIFSTVAAISIYAFLDTIILGFIKGYTDVGYYTAATKLNKITIPVLTSLGTVLIPQIAHAFKNKDLAQVEKLAGFSFEFVILMGVPMTFGLIALAPELISLFSGSAFLPSVLSMQIFAPVVLIIGLSNVWAIQILTPAGKDRQVTMSVCLGVISSLILNFILIPKLAFIGATIANLVSEFIVMLAFAYFSSAIIKTTIDIKVLMKTFLISLCFIPIIHYLRPILKSNDLMVCIAGIGICSLLYGFFQLCVFKNEIMMAQLNSIKSKIKR